MFARPILLARSQHFLSMASTWPQSPLTKKKSKDTFGERTFFFWLALNVTVAIPARTRKL
jgi:hypothetical protein